MIDRKPRIYVEAVERMVLKAGLTSVRRSCHRGDRRLACDALLVARHIDAPASVIEVDEAGTIAVSDTIFLHEVGPL